MEDESTSRDGTGPPDLQPMVFYGPPDTGPPDLRPMEIYGPPTVPMYGPSTSPLSVSEELALLASSAILVSPETST